MTKRKEVLIITIPQAKMVLDAVSGCVHDGKQTYDKYEVLKLISLMEGKLISVGLANSQTGYCLSESVKGGDTDAII